MKKHPTIVNFILDKSGSMSSVREATISGFNEYLNTLKKDMKNKYTFTLTLFDISIIRPTIAQPIKDVAELTHKSYDPNGNTALYDAVCSTIRTVNEYKDQNVITIIMTDGQENSSREYTGKDMKELIKEREEKGNWKFVFLGANQDSYAAAQQFGIPQGGVSNFNATALGMRASMATMATATINYMNVINTSGASAQDTAFFSETDKKSIEETK